MIDIMDISGRENRHVRAAIRDLAEKNKGTNDVGGMLIPRQRPHRNRKAYNRNRFKRMGD